MHYTPPTLIECSTPTHPHQTENRYLELEAQGGVLGWFLGMGLFRDRLLMDAQLLEKLGIEMAVGAAAQMVAEWDRRRDKLWQELDFAFADVLTWCVVWVELGLVCKHKTKTELTTEQHTNKPHNRSLVANFAAVLIAAPAVGGAVAAASASSSAVRRHIPANAFQMVPPGGQPYKLVDRGACF